MMACSSTATLKIANALPSAACDSSVKPNSSAWLRFQILLPSHAKQPFLLSMLYKRPIPCKSARATIALLSMGLSIQRHSSIAVADLRLIVTF